MLGDVIDHLSCPVCGAHVSLDGPERVLSCEAGHSFDVARQGYVNLLGGRAKPSTADSPAMVEARRQFLASGHFDSVINTVAETLADALASGPSGCVVDVGAGTGQYLSAALDALPGRAGLALDISKAAMSVAARAHERLGAVVCDVWAGFPVRTGNAAAVLDVFAPRNAAEFARVLHPEGLLVMATPTTRHLQELIAPLGLLTVGEDKPDRVARQLGDLFVLRETLPVSATMELTHPEVATLVSMGPSSHHIPAESLAERIAALPAMVRVTLSVELARYVRAA